VASDAADFEVLDAKDQAIAALKTAGAEIIDPFHIPDFDRLRQATGFCSRFRYDLKNYLASLGASAPIASLDSVHRDQRYLPDSANAMEWAMAVSGTPQEQTPPCIDVDGDPRRKQFLTAVVAAMDTTSLDAIIYPSWSYPPRMLGDLESPHGNNSPIIAPHTGQPAITVPMGFTSNGLPLGLQFLARPFDEHKLFQFAFAYEQATQHRRPPQGFGPLDQQAECYNDN
jgi:Asp-tRNA(Asn)/Glu-tRNA(Gln) amidotransferase A subunit family amidase